MGRTEPRNPKADYVDGIRKAAQRWPVPYRRQVLQECIGKLAAVGCADALWEYHKTRADLCYPFAKVPQPSAEAARLALEAVLHETDTTMNAIEQLKAMEAEIVAVVNRMAPSTRAAIGVLRWLSSLEGLSVDIEFGSTMLDEIGQAENVEKALLESGDGPDVGILRRAFDLAYQILDDED